MNTITMLVRKLGITLRIFLACFVFYFICNAIKQ